MANAIMGWAVVIYYAFLWGIVVPFDLVLRKRTPISLLGALAITPVLGEGAIIFWPSLIGSTVVWVYPLVLVLQPAVIEASLLQYGIFQIAGRLLICFSIVLAATAMAQVGGTYLINQAEPRLMTGGAYGLCRNPVYVGLSTGFLGVFLLMPSNVFLASWALYLVCNHVRVRREEHFLRRRFTEPFAAYCRHIGRYGPKFEWLARSDNER